MNDERRGSDAESGSAGDETARLRSELAEAKREIASLREQVGQRPDGVDAAFLSSLLASSTARAGCNRHLRPGVTAT